LTRFLTIVVCALAMLLVPGLAWAHKPSDAYLTLTVQPAKNGASSIDGRLDLALRDLDHAIGLDTDGDGSITWGEVQSRRSAIESYALSHLTLTLGAGASCALHSGDFSLVNHSDGTYAVVALSAACPSGTDDHQVLAVDYEIFFAGDPQHRGIVRLDEGGTIRSAIFADGSRQQRFDPLHVSSFAQLRSAVQDGVRHIFGGIDHILFLIALLLPSVLRRENGVWRPVPSFKVALLDVLRIVTAFTLAHSITLSLSTLGILRLPSRLIESAIAASVVLAAVNNIYPILKDDRWQAAFALGLLHGFGFSAVLMDAGLPRGTLAVTLFGFNVGVEIGQAVIVAIFLPLAYLARKTTAYRKVGLLGGSAVIACVATVWMVERALAIKIF
jgi:hypothetical protein